MFEKEIGMVQAGLEELEAFLQSEVVFWPIQHSREQLSLGGLLLSMRKAEALAVTGSQRAQWESCRVRLDALQQKYLAHWDRKASRETGTRLRMWSNYLEDYRQHPGNYAPDYPHEVRLRAMIELLCPFAHQADCQPAVAGLDQLLRNFFQPGDFVWEKALQASFPAQTFWYLYGSLKS